jgi:hypothetical protein
VQHHRLIYRSTATEEVVSNETLRGLESQASSANAKNDLSGLLILSGDRFLQVLEGPARELTAVFGRIIQDPRHHRVEFIAFEPIPERRFSDWHLRLVDLHDVPGPERARLAGKHPHVDGSILIPDEPTEAFDLLLDAGILCRSKPWASRPIRSKLLTV